MRARRSRSARSTRRRRAARRPGPTFINFGWALTPQPKIIPIDGSTMTVMVDGTPLGPVDYNHERPDIEALFPGFQNTAGANGAVGFRVIDTTTLTNGLHTISWTVTDSEGITEGIGSRFFTVSNGVGRRDRQAVDSAAASARATMARAEDIAPAPQDDAPVLARRGWDLDGPWRWYGVGGAGRAVIRGEEIDRFELALGEHAGAHYTGHLRVGEALAPLPVGFAAGRDDGPVHMGAGRRFCRALRPGVRAVGGNAGRSAARGAGHPRAEGEWPRRGAGHDRHPADATGGGATVRAGRVGGGSGCGSGERESTRCTCGRIRRRAARRCSWARRRSAARGRMSRRCTAISSASRASGSRCRACFPGTYDLAVFPWSNVTGGFAPPNVVHVTVR